MWDSTSFCGGLMWTGWQFESYRNLHFFNAGVNVKDCVVTWTDDGFVFNDDDLQGKELQRLWERTSKQNKHVVTLMSTPNAPADFSDYSGCWAAPPTTRIWSVSGPPINTVTCDGWNTWLNWMQWCWEVNPSLCTVGWPWHLKCLSKMYPLLKCNLLFHYNMCSYYNFYCWKSQYNFNLITKHVITSH